jgi:SAM-dependent methyltransferase
MADAAQFNADQLAFWNGLGGNTWVARQQHTDVTLAPVSAALLAFAGPRAGEQVLDVGCGCGESTLELARAVGSTGRVAALDISATMLAEGKTRAVAAGIANIDWRQADAATAALDGFDLLVSNFGLMFFGDPVPAFAHLRGAANPGARMAFVCWRSLAENPWIGMPMHAVAPHVPPRPKVDPQAPGMIAFADPQRVSMLLTAAGWSSPRFDKLDLDLDIAAGRARSWRSERAAPQSWKKPRCVPGSGAFFAPERVAYGSLRGVVTSVGGVGVHSRGSEAVAAGVCAGTTTGASATSCGGAGGAGGAAGRSKSNERGSGTRGASWLGAGGAAVNSRGAAKDCGAGVKPALLLPPASSTSARPGASSKLPSPAAPAAAPVP